MADERDLGTDNPLAEVLSAWYGMVTGGSLDLVALRALVVARVDQMEVTVRDDPAAAVQLRGAVYLVGVVDLMASGNLEEAGDRLGGYVSTFQPPESSAE